MIDSIATSATLQDEVTDDGAAFVQALVARDESAWRRLFAANYVNLVRFARARTGDQSLAEDLAADVFLEAIKGIRRFRYRGLPVRAWLFKIERHLIADHFSRQKRRARVSLESAVKEPASRTEIGSVEAKSDIMSAAASLKPDQQEVILLRFIHDLTPAEVAEAMGKRVGAVHVIQHRALAALRSRLGPREE
jgi:RNA polymerase sigma-70 factor (ECF subfamily)